MFENLKEKLLERIERDTVKSVVSYRPDKKLPDTISETVYLKRSKIPLIGDWTRIYPPVNEDNSWNIKNLIFGGNKNLIKLIMVGAVVAMVLLGYYEVFKYVEELRESCVPLVFG